MKHQAAPLLDARMLLRSIRITKTNTQTKHHRAERGDAASDAEHHLHVCSGAAHILGKTNPVRDCVAAAYFN